MPVLYMRGYAHDIACPYLLDRTSPGLNPPDSCGHDQNLAKRMRVSGSPRSGLKRNDAARYARRSFRGKELIDLYGTREVLRGTFRRDMGSASDDLDCLRGLCRLSRRRTCIGLGGYDERRLLSGLRLRNAEDHHERANECQEYRHLLVPHAIQRPTSFWSVSW